MPNRLAGDPGFYRALDEAAAQQERLGEMAGSTSFTAGAAQIGSSRLMDRTGAAGELPRMRKESPEVDQGLWDRTQKLAKFYAEFPGAMGGPVA